jgi:hypothetical protein
MKAFLLSLIVLFSTSAFSAFSEIECSGSQNGKDVRLIVEEAFPQGSTFRKGDLFIQENGSEQRYSHYFTVRQFGPSYQRVYTDARARLEVDLWPDNRPQWGRTYQSTLDARALGRSMKVRCRFSRFF